MFIFIKARKRGHFCEDLVDPKHFLLAGRGKNTYWGKKLVSLWFRQKPKK